MLQSKLFYKTDKNKSSDVESVSHDLLTRAGYVDQLMAGVYSFLPLGFRVLKNIEGIIRKNMVEAPANGQEILMPSLTPKENWVKTDRWENFDVLFKLKGAGDKDVALAPTHEEVVVPLAKKIVFSYKDLPISVFQFQNKFRNELRAKSGILRTREFLMKDLYSLHATQEDFEKYYDKMKKVYLSVFKQMGIKAYVTLASGGSFSKYSHEYQMVAEAGEDTIYICQKCKLAINKEIKEENPTCPECKGGDFEEKKAVEVGNIFSLGTKFSAPFDLKFRDKDGSEKPVIMGCYGIGLGRTMGAVVEANHDDKGIIWPREVAPFLAHLIPVGQDKKVLKLAEKLYTDLQKEDIEILYDERQDKTAGEKFADADLLGIPYRIVVSEKTLLKNSVELKERAKSAVRLVKIKEFIKIIKNG
ncbi:MAG: hypothetical protein A2599_01310 [Candidatus Staskawiczbacteria bacterium RIFOXYD1_FULL_39_28]|uniref:Proline--tRNA ligase n=1 Tax=Candidatus Staskawiczbacteria bacterium RIFOXYC1_FULL_38_18 TaxID=1802229 RepID=A0A1G2JH41_9BACT|nr:MAG: hypothetical protein A2401_02390 [Candidatus Staskawiczbacteria bacterium RIFOXYC1_FULL_38_18]OGZ92504.1 MAG: hypothetical protein A2599_01310 [Candidatus Staskawiczbacteria bacterium RIFOXYD1_FULL_39_28]